MTFIRTVLCNTFECTMTNTDLVSFRQNNNSHTHMLHKVE